MTDDKKALRLSTLEFCRVQLKKMSAPLEELLIWLNNKDANSAAMKSVSDCQGRVKLMLDVIAAEPWRESMAKQFYTVVLMYIDPYEPLVAATHLYHVEAVQIDDAVNFARAAAIKELCYGAPDDFKCLVVLRGAHNNIMPSSVNMNVGG